MNLDGVKIGKKRTKSFFGALFIAYPDTLQRRIPRDTLF
jgi:hypothetical protein